MKTALKAAALRGLTLPPIYAALRARALKKRPFTILCYHTLRPDDQPLDAWVALRQRDFTAQIAMLRQSYDIVSLDAALLPAGKDARPCVVLTFDDGEVGLVTQLLPLVRSLDIPVTVYVATRHIQTGMPYWFDRVMNALQVAGLTTITLDGLGVWQIGPARGKMRWAQMSAVLEAIKTAPTQDRDGLADQVVAQCGVAAPGFTPLQPMDLSQLQDLAADPRVTIGAHSHGHELLDQLSLADAEQSIVQSRDLLVAWTGRDVRHFAYPNGSYSPALMQVLKAQGFETATILEDRLVHSDAPRLALPRIGVGRYDALDRIRLRLVGV